SVFFRVVLLDHLGLASDGYHLRRGTRAGVDSSAEAQTPLSLGCLPRMRLRPPRHPRPLPRMRYNSRQGQRMKPPRRIIFNALVASRRSFACPELYFPLTAAFSSLTSRKSITATPGLLTGFTSSV